MRNSPLTKGSSFFREVPETLKLIIVYDHNQNSTKGNILHKKSIYTGKVPVNSPNLHYHKELIESLDPW